LKLSTGAAFAFVPKLNLLHRLLNGLLVKPDYYGIDVEDVSTAFAESRTVRTCSELTGIAS
jgi:hypothetical protein